MKVSEFRDAIDRVVQAYQSCRSAVGADELRREREWLRRVADELAAADCPRATHGDGQRRDRWLRHADELSQTVGKCLERQATAEPAGLTSVDPMPAAVCVAAEPYDPWNEVREATNLLRSQHEIDRDRVLGLLESALAHSTLAAAEDQFLATLASDPNA